MKLKIAVLFFLLISIAEAKPIKNKKHNLSICALFKNESKNLQEWIEYHRLIGVDHFYLYEIGATDRYLRILKPYINKKIVTLVSWPILSEKKEGPELFKWSLTTQVPAYENALHLYAKRETKWIIFLDVDEFIVPVNDDLLSSLLEKYDAYPGIVLGRDFFDASSALSRNFVIEAVDITKSPLINIQEGVSKIIFKPDLCTSFRWPPYECVFKDGKEPMKIERSVMRINCYLNRNLRSLDFKRKMLVDHKKIRESEIEELLDSGYDIEDQERVIHRFLPELAKKLNSLP